MASNNIILAKDFKVSNLTVGEVKKLDNGRKYVPIFYNNSSLYLQTPECYAPYGLSYYKHDDMSESYSLDLSFKDMDKTKSLEKFYKCLKDVDTFNMKKGCENDFSWFKRKNTSLDVIEALYTPVVKHFRDKETGEITNKYPATFKMKIPFINSKFQCDFFNEKKESVNILDLNTKGAKVTAIVQCTGLWIGGGKFGLTFKAKQLLIKPIQKIEGFCIRMNTEDMIESIDTSLTDSMDQDKPIVLKKNAEYISNSEDDEEGDEGDEEGEEEGEEEDDEEDDEEEEEEEEIQEPVVKTKRNTKFRN